MDKRKLGFEIHRTSRVIKRYLDNDATKSYIEKMAKKFWNLFYPDEEIFFNDRNS